MFIVIASTLFVAASALAQESECKSKMKEDLDGYAKGMQTYCNATATVEWTGGKLGHNPREGEKEGWNALAFLCTSAIDSVGDACRTNEPVKKAMSAVKKVECKKGKGTLAYSLKGSTL